MKHTAQALVGLFGAKTRAKKKGFLNRIFGTARRLSAQKTGARKGFALPRPAPKHATAKTGARKGFALPRPAPKHATAKTGARKGFALPRPAPKHATAKTGARKGFFKIAGNQGQGLIEYLILVALMGVASIGIIRTLNQTVKSRFANAVYALQGKNQKAKTHSMKKEEYQRSDLSNFMSGSASADKKDKKK